MAKTKTENKGKGLAALLTDAEPKSNAPSLTFIELADITPSKLNPRKEFDENYLKELAESIKKVGVIQPVTVRPIKGGGYEMVCGECRSRSAKIAGLVMIPASVRDLTDAEALECMITENLQRKDVHPLEESNAFHMMLDQMGYEIAGIAAKIGKNDAFVLRRLQLKELIKPLKKLFTTNEINIGHAELLSRVDNQVQQLWFDDQFSSSWNGGAGTVKALNQWLNNRATKKLRDAPFKTDQPYTGKHFVCEICTVCPKNSAFNSTLFPDTADEAICYSPQCYSAKTRAEFEIKLDKALANPKLTLVDDSYGNDHVKKLKAKLIADGFNVLERTNFQLLSKPSPWKYSRETDEEFKAREKAEIDEYKAKKASCVKGFSIDDGDTFDILIISQEKAVQNEAGSARKEFIADINAKKKRGLELDREKIMKRLVEKIKGSAVVTTPENAQLSVIEMDCLIALAFNSHGGGDEIYKLLKLDRNQYPSSHGPKIVAAINAASPELKALIVRKAIFYTFNAIYPDSMNGGVLFHLAKDWCPDELAQYEADQKGVRERREAKLDQKIKEYDNQNLVPEAN